MPKNRYKNKMCQVWVGSWECPLALLAQLKRVISSNCYKALLIGCLIKLRQNKAQVVG